MRREYLGDYLDHFKAAVIRVVLSCTGENGLAVVPMPTEPQPWPQGHKALYASLLGVPPSQIVWAPGGHTQQPAKSGRDAWLAALCSLPQQHIFLDPDTGLAHQPSRKHVTWDDLRSLCDSEDDRVIIVYQHGGQRIPKDHQAPGHVAAYVSWFLSQLTQRGFARFAYQGAQASMLFISANSAPVKPLRVGLEKMLGGLTDVVAHRLVA